MTSATSSSGPRSTSIPTDAQITAVSDPLPQILEGIPLRLRSIRVNLDRPGLRPQPDQLRPVRGERAGLRRPGRRWPALSEPLPGRQLRDASVRPEARPEALRVDRSGPGNPALHATLTARPGEANIASTVRSPCRRASSSTTPTSGAPCTRVQFAAERLPGSSSVIGTAEAMHPAARQAARRARLPAVSPTHKLPDLVADLEGQIDIDLDRPHRLRPERRPADDLRNGSRRAGQLASS